MGKVKAKAKTKAERDRAPGAPYTVAQAAAVLNLPTRTVRQRIADGILVAYQDGRLLRIRESDLLQYQQSRPMASCSQVAPPRVVIRRRHLRLE